MKKQYTDKSFLDDCEDSFFTEDEKKLKKVFSAERNNYKNFNKKQKIFDRKISPRKNEIKIGKEFY